MQEAILQITRSGPAIILTLNRPQALNALNTAVIDTLHEFFSAGYQAYDPFTAVIITGSGEKAFAAGADITEFRGMDAQEGQAFARRGHEAFLLIERFHRPVIAAVNGFALGGGCELAMACHLRIASDNARFGQPEVNLGLIPGYGGTQRLIQLIGKGKAMELLLTGDMINAETALQTGLVNQVTPPGQLLEACQAVVAKIASRGPLAIAKIIASVNAFFETGTDGFEQEVRHFASLMDSRDFVEGTSAFLEKRKPQFTGA